MMALIVGRLNFSRMIYYNHRRSTMTTVSAHKLKITTIIKAEELLQVPAPDGKPRVILRVKFPDGRVLSADLAAKSVRKAQASIRELGSENIALVLQGALTANDVVTEAGLVAQPKTKKETAAAEIASVDPPGGM